MVGFIKTQTPEDMPIVEKNFTHGVCIGQTGCGKTSSFMLPNIKQRLQDNHGMFIIDFKGNLNLQVKALALEENRLKDVIEIGVAWGDSINLLSGVSKTLFLQSIEKLVNNQDEKFWVTSSLNLIGNIYDILKYKEYITSLEMNRLSHLLHVEYVLDIKSFIKITESKESVDRFCYSMQEFLRSISLDNGFDLRINKDSRDYALTEQFYEKLEKITKKLQIFGENIDEDKPAAGSGGVLFQARNLLVTYDQDGLDGDKDIVTLLEDRKVVILRADSFTKNATEGLMHILYTRLSMRDEDMPISLFIDEFQRTVTKDSLPFVDVFREMRVELIAAFQNRAQLNNKIGNQEADEFLGNIVDIYEYAQKDENTLKTFEYQHNNKTLLAKPIFFSKTHLYETQYLWQKSKNRSIKKGAGRWIYKKSIDMGKTIIHNIKNNKSETYFVLEKEFEREEKGSVFEHG